MILIISEPDDATTDAVINWLKYFNVDYLRINNTNIFDFLRLNKDNEGKLLLNSNSRKQFKAKFKNYSFKLKSEEWNQKEFQNHFLPLIAFVNHADTFGLRYKTIEMIKTG